MAKEGKDGLFLFPGGALTGYRHTLMIISTGKVTIQDL